MYASVELWMEIMVHNFISNLIFFYDNKVNTISHYIQKMSCRWCIACPAVLMCKECENNVCHFYVPALTNVIFTPFSQISRKKYNLCVQIDIITAIFQLKLNSFHSFKFLSALIKAFRLQINN